MMEPTAPPSATASPTSDPSGPAAPVAGDTGGPPSVPAGSDDVSPRLLEVEDVPPGTFGELEPAHPPLIDAQGRVRLSFSRIDTYRTCPRKFRYAYVDKLPGKPGPALSFGTSVHNALEAFYDRKLPECPTVDDLLGFLYDGWEHRGFVDLPREEQVSYYRHAQSVLRRFHQRAAPDYRLPVATEAWFELPVRYEAVVVGSIDRVDVDDDGRFHVVDYKTNRKVRDRARVAKSLQLSIYALACQHLYGALPATVTLDFVVPGVQVTATLDELDLDAARDAILATAAAVRAEVYPPEPNRLCDWCDFKALCPAWPDDPAESLGEVSVELASRRRQAARAVEDLRALEAAAHRLRAELDDPSAGEGAQVSVEAPVATDDRS